MVVAHLGVLKHPPWRRHPAQLRAKRSIRRTLPQRRKRLGQLRDQVLAQVAAVGAWIGQQLVLLVQRLRQAQGALRRPAKATVAGALQARQIEQQRRRFAHGLLLDRLDLDRRGLVPVAQRLRERHGGQAALLLMLPSGLERLGAASRGQVRLHFEVVARHKAQDRVFARRKQPQRRRLHPSQRAQHVRLSPPPQRHRAGRVHPHQPVGL